MNCKKLIAILMCLYFTVGIVMGQEATEATPSGQPKIVFTRQQGSAFDLYMMGADGNDVERLTTNGGLKFNPDLSPDGTKIVYQGRGLFVFDIATRTETSLVSDERAGSPKWSPDGKTVVYSSLNNTDESTDNEIWSINVDGSNAIQLTDNTISDIEPKFSPEGNQIIFAQGPNVTFNIDGSLVQGEGEWLLSIMNADGSDLTVLYDEFPSDTQRISRVSYSSDASQLVFSLALEKSTEIFLLDADGNNLTQLTDNTFDEDYPTWTVDGARIIFIRTGEFFFTMKPDGSDSKQLLNLDGIVQYSVGYSDAEFVGFPPIELTLSQSVSLTQSGRFDTLKNAVDFQVVASGDFGIRITQQLLIVAVDEGGLFVFASEYLNNLEFDDFFLPEITLEALNAITAEIGVPYTVIAQGESTISDYGAYVFEITITDSSGTYSGYFGTIALTPTEGLYFLLYYPPNATLTGDRLLATLLSFRVDDPSVIECRVTISAQTANVRSDAGTNFDINFVVSRGEVFTADVKKEVGNFVWYQISKDGQTGWVRSDLLETNADCGDLE